jgi:hypothetical protein
VIHATPHKPGSSGYTGAVSDSSGHLEALADDADVAGSGDADTDFADEHADTAVDESVVDDDSGEDVSPRGWDGMDGDKIP